MLRYLFFVIFSMALPAFAAESAKCAEKTGVLFAAYAGVWIVTLVLVIRISLKASRTAKDIESLHAQLRELEQKTGGRDR